jgi:phosphoribosylglycinamide formyltransferase-1
MKALRLAILSSSRGTDMLALLAAIEKKQLAASIALVISDKAQALILARAQERGLRTAFIEPQNTSREAFEQKISRLLEEEAIDLILLIGFMRILSKEFVTRWQNKIINVHPSLLPAFAGGRDQNVHQAVLAAKIAETGCTVHYVTEQVDQGPIIVQKRCAVLPQDTVDTLKERVQALEGQALVEAVSLLAIA